MKEKLEQKSPDEKQRQQKPPLDQGKKTLENTPAPGDEPAP